MRLPILLLTRRMADTPPDPTARLDLFGTVLSAIGLSLLVFGILKAGTWGFVDPKEGAPTWFGLSPVIWMWVIGAAVLGAFVLWEQYRIEHGKGALIDPAMLKIPQLRGGLVAFFFQFLLQMGLFFVVPLFLSVALGLTRYWRAADGLRLDVGGYVRALEYATGRRAVVLGKPAGTERADPELEALDNLSEQKFWPVDIAYFDDIAKGGEDTPEYRISFKLYENGLTRDLEMDYGDFVITGKLVDLDVFEADRACAR